MTRDDLMWEMAEAAWGYYYCHIGASGDLCGNCKSAETCFELGEGFKRGENRIEWRLAAEGSLLAMEKALGISVLNNDSDAMHHGR